MTATGRVAVDAAHAAGIWVGICGEMGGDIAMTPLLVGLGVDELSCGAAVLPRVKRAVQSLETAACEKLVAGAMECDLAKPVDQVHEATWAVSSSSTFAAKAWTF